MNGDSVDYLKLCERAIGTLARRGVLKYIERDELISAGYEAIVTAEKAKYSGREISEALAVRIARCGMLNTIRNNSVRQWGRVPLPECDAAGNPYSVTEALNTLWAKTLRYEPRYGMNIRENLWDSLPSLSEREYFIVVRTFWGDASQAEIAQDLSLSQRAVGKILKRAIKNLREVLNVKSRGITLVEGKLRISRKRQSGDHMLLTLAEVARRLGVCDKTARTLVKDLPSVKVNNRVRYPESAVQSFITNAKKPEPESLAS